MKVPKELRIGMIGLDTSHVSAFCNLLNNPSYEFHVPGGKVVVAYPGGGSSDFEMSFSRLGVYTKELQDQYGVKIVESPEAVAEQCDVILLESVDGRVHLEQFSKIAPFGKPVFVDKPFSLCSKESQSMMELAQKYDISLMSCSALRFAEGLIKAIAQTDKGAIIGADCYGPLALQSTQPGLFWYGIHTADMLYHILGKGCHTVDSSTNEDHDIIVGTWKDGRMGTIRGNRKGNNMFGGVIHREQGSDFIDIYAHEKPYYASLLEHVMRMFTTGEPSIDPQETLEIIRFLEAGNESRSSGRKVSL